MSDTLKILRAAGSIPAEATVTKRTGSNLYRIMDQLTLYTLSGSKQLIKAEEGARLLVPLSDVRSISSIGSTTELVWLASVAEVRDFLSDRNAPGEQDSSEED